MIRIMEAAGPITADIIVVITAVTMADIMEVLVIILTTAILLTSAIPDITTIIIRTVIMTQAMLNMEEEKGRAIIPQTGTTRCL